MKVKAKILNEAIRNHLPTYGTVGSAGLDLRAVIDSPIAIAPNQVVKIGTGLSIWLENSGYASMILPRSGMGHKGLVLGNLVGLIDSDYQGELIISAWNRSETAIVVNPMDKIAQLVVVPVVQLELDIVEEFSATDRGANGFGHTG